MSLSIVLCYTVLNAVSASLGSGDINTLLNVVFKGVFEEKFYNYQALILYHSQVFSQAINSKSLFVLSLTTWALKFLILNYRIFAIEFVIDVSWSLVIILL